MAGDGVLADGKLGGDRPVALAATRRSTCTSRAVSPPAILGAVLGEEDGPGGLGSHRMQKRSCASANAAPIAVAAASTRPWASRSSARPGCGG